jgi:dephospho-CoA kinase
MADTTHRSPLTAHHSPLVLGLIGGIGSGKSRVAAELQRHGAVVLVGDKLGHEALLQPVLRDQVVRRWGTEVLNATGEVDRRKLGRIVFGDPAELRALERIVHPFIERGFREGIARVDAPLVVLDAAVLLEAGWNEMCDRIVYIDAPRPLRLQRLAAERGWSIKEVEAREQVQMSLTEKASRADVAVDNSGSPEHLARQVLYLLDQWGIVK